MRLARRRKRIALAWQPHCRGHQPEQDGHRFRGDLADSDAEMTVLESNHLVRNSTGPDGSGLDAIGHVRRLAHAGGLNQTGQLCVSRGLRC